MDSDVEVMDKAIDLIQDHWTQGFWCVWRVDEDGETTSYCIEGALGEAITGQYQRMANQTRDRLFRDARNYVFPLIRDWSGIDMSEDQKLQYDRLMTRLAHHWGKTSAMAFNDHPETTEEDVLLGMKHVREELANED